MDVGCIEEFLRDPARSLFLERRDLVRAGEEALLGDEPLSQRVDQFDAKVETGRAL
jgi:hypothetical protein